MAFPGTLNYLPEEIQSALDLIAEFDQLFLVGFANIDFHHLQTLNSWQNIFAGTPLDKPIKEACRAIETNEFVEKHFSALAATRAGLQGSIYDALQNQICSVLGRSQTSEETQKIDELVNQKAISQEIPAHIPIWQESIRHWLMEIALVGFNRLDKTTLIPFIPTLEQIQGEPLLIRQSALLTGYFNELIRQVPMHDSSSIPLFRWVDLWTQAVIGGLRSPIGLPTKVISGNFIGLGMDLKSHANLVNLTIYGLLTSNNTVQVAKINQSIYKVDAIRNQEIWQLFAHTKILLEAFSNQQTLQLENISILPTGDLIWQGEGKLGDKYKLMEVADKYFSISQSVEKPEIGSYYLTADSRHPIQICEPILLRSYQIQQTETKIFLNWGEEGELEIDCDRFSIFSELTVENILTSSEIFGLIRFDNCRWKIQPLAVTVNKKLIYTGQNAAKAIQGKTKTNTVGILQERASRLLRKKV